MKVKVKHKLGSINEGRTDEMEFTFLSKQKTQYETVMPFTTCKDFLNDKVWAELYKKDAGIVYKFKGTYTKLFEQENYYLAF